MTKDEIQPFMEMINKHAHVAMKKIRRPTVLSHEDLVSEGIVLLLEVEKRWFSEERGASLKTLFTQALRQYFGDIVRKSYASYRCFLNDEQRRKYIEHIIKNHTDQDPQDLACTNILLEELTQSEKDYAIRMLLSPFISIEKRREETRKILNISSDQEKKIRTSISTKLQNVQD